MRFGFNLKWSLLLCLNLSLLSSLRFKFGRVGPWGVEFAFELSFRIGRVGTLGVEFEFGFEFEIEFEFQNW